MNTTGASKSRSAVVGALVRCAHQSMFALLVVLILIFSAYLTATSDPRVRKARLQVLGPGARGEITLLLLSDIHVAGPDMTPEREKRIVEQMNGLQPDIVLIAGDFISDRGISTSRYTFEQAVEPLQGLHSRLGSFAVLGNHDHGMGARQARDALRRAGITVLDNDGARAGPLVIGGLDDPSTGHENLPRTVHRMMALGGFPILLSHSPNPFPKVPQNIGLMVAGHTHCGQIRLPVIGVLLHKSEGGDRYSCGVYREGSKTLIVSAGLGTSIVPLRLGTIPDVWLITLSAKQPRKRPTL